MDKKLSIINLGISNIGSLLEAFRRIGADYELIDSAGQIGSAECIVLPGVGSFRDGMAALLRNGLAPALHRHAELDKPLLGICLGMQMLFESSQEQGQHEGLGLLKGHVRRLEISRPDMRVPNMGWCDVMPSSQTGKLLTFGTTNLDSFYFLHSFWCDCADETDVAATIDFGYPVTAAVERGHLCGVQFHPEKSQDAGLDLLASFWNNAKEQLS